MSEQQPARRRSGGRLLAHPAVVVGVVAVAAAAFVLSYSAVRDIALAAGVTASLARLYPAILDAVFVVACAAALTLRDARWWTRGYAWLSVLVTGALIGAADAYHAMGLRLPHKVAAGIVAALPVVLVLLGFSLWLSMLRHTRWSRTAAAPGPRVPAELSAGPTLVIGTGQPAPAEAVSAAARPALPAPAASLSPAMENTRPDEGVPADAESVPSNAASVPVAEDSPAAESGPPADQSSSGTEGAPPAAPEPAPGPAPGRAAETTPEPVAGPAAAQQPAPAEPAAERPAEALTPPYGFPSAASLNSAPVDEAPVDEAPADEAPADEAPADEAPADEAPVPRTPAPTFLSAPVLETAEPGEPGEGRLPDRRAEGHLPDRRLVALAPEAVAARGKPPTPLAVQPAELAHEAGPAGLPDPAPGASAAQLEADRAGHPAADAEPGETQQKGRGTAGPPARFERVRSTPTPPGG